MAPDEEPPSLGKPSSSPIPPTSAFGGGPGNAPPPAAFSHSGTSEPSRATPPLDDLNKRWKQHQQEMESHRGHSSLSPSSNNSNSGVQVTVDDDDESLLSSEMGQRNPYSNYAATPRVVQRGVSDGSIPVGYSFKKSASYDTNELIRKYSGVTGISPNMGSSSGNLPRPSSFRRSSSVLSSTSSAVREEALQVLDLVDEHLNASFHVRRTESGGFRAQASSMAGGNSNGTPYSIDRTDSGNVIVEHAGTEDENEQIQPYYVKRTSSGTVTSGRSTRRTPAALSGLGLSDSAINNSRTPFKSGRYSFSDPKFREDDFLAEEEDEIIGPAGTFDENDPNVEVPLATRRNYNDNPASTFEGDFPRGSATWSSRYMDSPNRTKRMLDDWDQGRYGSRERQSARNMFMSTATSMRDAANSVGDAVAVHGARVFGAGFSFRQKHTFGSQKDTFNLRTLWKDNDDEEQMYDENIQGPRVHKTWQQVMLSKKRRRRIGCTLLCLVLACILLGVSISMAKDKRQAKQDTESSIQSPSGEPILTFYATCNTPYNKAQEQQLQESIAAIPDDASFFVHLGNLQDASSSFCPPRRFFDMASLFEKSPIPFTIIPGEEDWVKCPEPGVSLTRWLNAFLPKDESVNNLWRVPRSEENPELFSSLQDGVLFFGLHLVNGSVDDEPYLEEKHRDMRFFLLTMLNHYQGQFRAVVMFGNARPGHRQHGFFESVSDALLRVQVPIAYIHSDSGEGNVEYTPLSDMPFIHGIQVPSGGEEKPLRIRVGYGPNPFRVG